MGMKIVGYCQILFSALICIGVGGCGGGTTGTGDYEAKLFTGRVTASESTGEAKAESTGTPVSGVKVTVKESGDSAFTDANGDYAITTSLEPGQVSLLVEGEGVEEEVAVGDIQPGQTTVKVDLQITVTGQVSVTSFEINPRTDDEEEGGADGEEVVPDEEEGLPPTEEEEELGPLPSLFKGSVVFSDGVPVKGAAVSLDGSGKSDTTGSNGAFSIETMYKKDQAQFTIKFKDIAGGVTVSLPKGSVVVSLTIKLTVPSSVGTSISTIGPLGAEIEVESQQVRRRKRK